MSQLATERLTAPPSAESEAPGPPTIAANRRQIDDRFPTVAFTVRSNGRPFYEVIVTTDRSLFDPANRDRRTEANFYSSRQDGGLTPALGGEAVYLVPAAVLRRFAQAEPKPRELYYTVAAYETAGGEGAVFALLPERLVQEGPSVSIASGFSGHTLARVLSVPTQKLTRIATLTASAAAPAPSPEEDRAAGEDGTTFVADVPALAPEVDILPARSPVTYSDGLEDVYGPIDADGLAVWGDRVEPTALEEGDDVWKDEEWEEVGRWEQPSAGAVAAPEPDVGYAPLEGGPEAVAPAAPRPLTLEDQRMVIERIAETESGSHRYSAINADGEFKGRFGPDHPAYQRYHVGLSYGIIQFTQDSGSLGQLLTMMRDRDPQSFDGIFGPDATALVSVTSAPGPPSRESPGGRSARVQPVGGADLWEDPWLDRFRRAGDHLPFQAAQNELAATNYLQPMLQFAGWLGLDTDRALTIVVDRAVQMGVQGARHWIIDAVGPVSTTALRQQALGALGQEDLRGFQAATDGLVADNLWGPLTHAAMVSALRRLGSESPVPIPTRDQMLDAIVRRAAGELWGPRVERLRGSTAFTDTVFLLQ
jgi:hypothetical protein